MSRRSGVGWFRGQPTPTDRRQLVLAPRQGRVVPGGCARRRRGHDRDPGIRRRPRRTRPRRVAHARWSTARRSPKTGAGRSTTSSPTNSATRTWPGTGTRRLRPKTPPRPGSRSSKTTTSTSPFTDGRPTWEAMNHWLPGARPPSRAACPWPTRSSSSAPRMRCCGTPRAGATSTSRAASPCSTPAIATAA